VAEKEQPLENRRRINRKITKSAGLVNAQTAQLAASTDTDGDPTN
jgi:hypothetical protein